MRKYALVAVAALAAALCATPVASAIQGTQGIKAKLAHNKAGTKKKPRSVGTLTVTTTTTPAPGEVGHFATKTAVIFFDKNLVFGGAKFKSCSAAGAVADTCPKGSVVGSGSANAQASIGGPEALTVKAYNGPRGNTIFLHVQGTVPLQINGILTGRLANASGRFGKKLVVTIPANLQQPLPNVFGTLTSFITKVGGVSKKTPYVGLRGCTGGKLHFAGTFSYTDGTSKSASATAPCKK
jgi:hypothetical protein